MRLKNPLMLIIAGTLLLAVSFPSHARGVYGNVGYHEYPWSVLIGYNDYGRSYDRGHRHGHHGHKHGHYRHNKKHYKHHYKKHYKRHHDYGYRKHYYNKHRDHYYKRDRYRRSNRCDY